jgi:hypothetical protein
MATYEGRCHCGSLTVAYETDLDPAAQAPRSCACRFCRMHATAALSDPAGHIAFSAKDPEALSRYTFGLGITDFLVCRTCGVYMGAFMPDGDGAYANVMASVLNDRDRFSAAPVAVVRTEEDEAGKRARRRQNWSPATLRIGNEAG